MTHPAVDRGVRVALVALTTCAVSAACARRNSADLEAERARVASADSARSARAERSRSSATQAVDFTDEERKRFTRVEQMIQARFTGVTVTQQGSGYSIQIRGTSSFGSSNEPLVIIDGATRALADLRGIEPRDVQRIEIVKDAAASYYGVRGANGVIVITTRRAR
ncbi:TonB-dependent outer membrane protein SusC/RagA, conserved site (plasmid) [Gemmatirosa kalamazoonensis]|uniref:TonB-dependent outer membrane protein SusC/RagA, conserved site n=1 Tax=Gemmatirosa kalamazoonensis TaxID=861299 RepID=W0RW74_9BACT|nr:TonB-dependent receptor plug domain-containing protein [Gemmatirosa kalamazoonensis]AHG93828.1 TonB-dependent outer membrane protein SusC/RagA, conserved site [Gemmatirosa kalamazoonensis]